MAMEEEVYNSFLFLNFFFLLHSLFLLNYLILSLLNFLIFHLCNNCDWIRDMFLFSMERKKVLNNCGDRYFFQLYLLAIGNYYECCLLAIAWRRWSTDCTYFRLFMVERLKCVKCYYENKYFFRLLLFDSKNIASSLYFSKNY